MTIRMTLEEFFETGKYYTIHLRGGTRVFGMYKDPVQFPPPVTVDPAEADAAWFYRKEKGQELALMIDKADIVAVLHEISHPSEKL